MVKNQVQSAILSLQDIRQTPEYACFMEKIGWKVEEISNETIKIFIKKLPLLPFSILKILRYHPPLPEIKLAILIKKNHVFLSKLQPFVFENCKLKIENFFPDSSPLLPTKTIWLDLTQPEGELIKQMKPKTRYNLKLAQRNNLKSIIISGDKITNKQLVEFHRLWSKNKPFNWLFKPSFHELKSLVDSFGEKCFFVLVFDCHSEAKPKNLAKRHLLRSFQSLDPSLSLRMTKKSLISACLVLTSRNIASYWHNFSTPEAKKLFAPTLYVWQAIKEAKRRQLKVFDFEGIWDDRMPKLNRGWKGFSRFKESFGGQFISFVWPKQKWFTLS